MKRVMTGCLIGMLGLMSITLVTAQDVIVVPTEESQPLVEATVELSPVGVVSPTVEVTVSEIPPVVTSETLETPATLTETPTPDLILSQTAAAVTQTQTIIVLPPTDGSAPVIPVQTITEAPNLRAITGQALYPNHLTGQAFIEVRAFAPDNTLVATTTTDANGNYALTVLADQVTRIEVDAPLHMAETLYVAPGISPLLVILRAGDLDSDGCVGVADINMLTSSYGQAFAGADIDGSGLVDVVDLTLLSSNYDQGCTAPVETPSLTPDAPPVATNEIIATVEILPTAEVIPTEAVSPIPTEPLATVEPSPIATEQPTLPSELPPTEVPLPVEPTTEATSQL